MGLLKTEIVITEDQLLQKLKQIAKTIGRQTYGLVEYRPHPYGFANGCFYNVESIVAVEGGTVQYGWMFVHRITASFPSVGYIIAIHHAVLKMPNGKLVDITPFHPDKKHQPLNKDGKIYFLADSKALPKKLNNGLSAPLCSQFFPLNEGIKLAAYIEQLRAEEPANCQKNHEEMERNNPFNIE